MLHYQIGPAVRRAIAERNLSQNELARRCGLSPGYISQLLSGQRSAGPVVRARLLDPLPGLTFADLFEEASSWSKGGLDLPPARRLALYGGRRESRPTGCRTPGSDSKPWRCGGDSELRRRKSRRRERRWLRAPLQRQARRLLDL